jgi:hypothetical protein
VSVRLELPGDSHLPPVEMPIGYPRCDNQSSPSSLYEGPVQRPA